MQFITSLFGGSGNTILTMIFALGAVLVLIVLAAWLLKLLMKASGNAGRGRNRRLSVVDTLVLDQKRQLLIVRRDSVEHLILVGGPQDVVVETGIAVSEQPASAPTRRPLPTIARRPVPNRPQPAARPALQGEEPAPAVPPAPRPSRSLRHTGLLRPVPAGDDATPGQNRDSGSASPADSAREGEKQIAGEGAALENDGSNEAQRG